MTPLLVLLGTIAGAWYLLIVRPQKEQQTRHGRLVERLQVGDHVLTVGGIYGRVVAIEQTTVVLELAPGLTSRIATDGIARIVHGGEAAIPTNAAHGGAHASPTSPQAMEDDMHHPHDPHQQQHQPAVAPQQQFAQPAVLPQQPFVPQPQHVAGPAYPVQPVHAVQPVTAVQPAPSFEPRPWGDVQPQAMQQHAPAPVQQVAPQLQPATYAQPPMQVQPQVVQHQQVPQYQPAPQPPYAQPQSTFVPPQPPPMPLHVPFAQQAAPVQHHVVPTPQHQPHVTHVPQQHLVAPTTQVPVVHVHQQQPQVQVQPQVHLEPETDTRRHSRAPKGMGSSLRLDDPSLRDTIARARDERADLADEYRKLTAPLVDTTEQLPQVQHGAAQPQFVGHDANGVALFATPGVPGVHPIEQYPASAVPRPVVQQPATVDPALQSTAFQRPAPYSPQQHDGTHAHAHTHA